jgi:hypothetical protein
MTETLKRAYTCKDVDMLTATGTINKQAIANKVFLISKRAIWADPFFLNFDTRINNAFINILGIDNAQQMREATQAVIGIQASAMRDTAEFKIQVTEDFKNNKPRRDEILSRLGFTAHLKAAQKGDQEALIELLYNFKQNMTVTLKAEITAAGTSTALITSITGYADTLKNSDVTQETMKGNRKQVTQSGVKELNEIYNQIISIARISAKFYKDDKAMKDKFSFSKTLKALNKVSGNGSPLSPTT